MADSPNMAMAHQEAEALRLAKDLRTAPVQARDIRHKALRHNKNLAAFMAVHNQVLHPNLPRSIPLANPVAQRSTWFLQDENHDERAQNPRLEILTPSQYE